MAERFELADEAPGDAVGVLAGEVVVAGIVVELAGLEHVPDRGQDGEPDRGDGLVVPAPAAQALILRGQLGVLGPASREGGFGQGGSEPLVALAGLAEAACAGRLIVAGAHLGPGREVLGCREHGHLDTELSDQHLGGALADTGELINSSRWRANGSICTSISSERRAIDSSRKSMCARTSSRRHATSASKLPLRPGQGLKHEPERRSPNGENRKRGRCSADAYFPRNAGRLPKGLQMLGVGAKQERELDGLAKA